MSRGARWLALASLAGLAALGGTTPASTARAHPRG
jgi:hypothetical protein